VLTRLLLVLCAVLCVGGAPGDRYDRRYAEDILTALVCAECSVCADPAERQAVAASVIHRAGSRHPRRLERVILAPGQYADIEHCRDSPRARKRMLPAVRAALRGADPAEGATSFHARWTCSLRPRACHHRELGVCEDTVWPQLQEVEVPDWFQHRFYRRDR